MKLTKLRIFLIVLAVIIIALASVALFFYQQGGKEHFVPPSAESESPIEQALADLQTISKSLDAFNSMNLKYPDRLEELQPDFITRVPTDPATGKAYMYQSDGTTKYSVSVPDPSAYKQKVLAIENGKIKKE